MSQHVETNHILRIKINILQEYWVKTYRGNDIETIEIVTEVDEEGSGASKAKRVFNYRVCMIKGALIL